MATPAYATQLLGSDVVAHANASSMVDAGSTDARPGSPEPRKPAQPPNWVNIAARIAAEDSAMPDDAAFMMTASNLFGSAGDEGTAASPTLGAKDARPPPHPIGGDNAPVPQTLTLVVGADAPFIEILAEFKTAGEADRWERDLPMWKRKIVTNPVVLLSGFSSLASRAQISREENTLRMRIALTTAELQRLLNLAANLTRTALARSAGP